MSLIFLKLLFHRVVFAVSFVCIIGLCLFFHFYLGHEISEIENWLYYYSGAIIILISCIRLFLSYISIGANIGSLSLIRVTEMFRELDAKIILSIFSIGLFSCSYFYLLNIEELTYRDQLVARPIVLLFITCFDITATHLLLLGHSKEEMFKYGIADFVLVTIGILFLYQNLHLNLLFLSYYFGCYLLYLTSQNIGTVFIYWAFVFLPLSITLEKKGDLFSVEYQDLFSTLVIMLGHLIPLLWSHFGREGELYGAHRT